MVNFFKFDSNRPFCFESSLILPLSNNLYNFTHNIFLPSGHQDGRFLYLFKPNF